MRIRPVSDPGAKSHAGARPPKNIGVLSLGPPVMGRHGIGVHSMVWAALAQQEYKRFKAASSEVAPRSSHR